MNKLIMLTFALSFSASYTFADPVQENTNEEEQTTTIVQAIMIPCQPFPECLVYPPAPEGDWISNLLLEKDEQASDSKEK